MENPIILVDTDVIINYVKTNQSSLLERYLRLQAQKEIRLNISVITVFEYFSGISPKKIDAYRDTEELFRQFHIHEITNEIAKLAAKLNYEKKLYRFIELADILIGATALHLNIPILTENKKHFKRIPNLKFVQ